jgi:hypothetical protein
MNKSLTLKVSKAILVHKADYPDTLYITMIGSSPIVDMSVLPTFKLTLTQNTGEKWIKKNMPTLEYSISGKV